MTREDERRAKNTAWRASRGLQPKEVARAACRKRSTYVHDRTRKARHEETYEDRLDDLGESPDF
jgi:hypothetical protein